MVDYKAMEQKQREEFIQARVREEQKIEKFAKELSAVNIEEVFGNIYIPPEISLKALCPEAYADDPDPDVYQEQFLKMREIFAAIMQRISDYNAEAAELNKQFREMYAVK